jgi:hypothetical protein
MSIDFEMVPFTLSLIKMGPLRLLFSESNHDLDQSNGFEYPSIRITIWECFVFPGNYGISFRAKEWLDTGVGRSQYGKCGRVAGVAGGMVARWRVMAGGEGGIKYQKRQLDSISMVCLHGQDD